MAMRVTAIGDAEIRPAAEFLHANLNRAVPADAWAAAMTLPWKVDAPNHGFLLADGDTVAGVYLAFYSEREIDGRVERFCNLGAWAVLEEQRLGGVRLLKALLAQDGYTFTDLSPSGSVPAMNTRLGFSFLGTETALVPNVPLPGRGSVSEDPEVLEATLTGRDLEIFRDHREAAAAHHVLLRRGREHCYVIFRRDRRKGLPLFASVLHVSDPELFHRMAGSFARHLLVKHRLPVTLVETRVAKRQPKRSVLLREPRKKMFRSDRLTAEQIDYLYSELVCVAW